MSVDDSSLNGRVTNKKKNDRRSFRLTKFVSCSLSANLTALPEDGCIDSIVVETEISFSLCSHPACLVA